MLRAIVLATLVVMIAMPSAAAVPLGDDPLDGCQVFVQPSMPPRVGHQGCDDLVQCPVIQPSMPPRVGFQSCPPF